MLKIEIENENMIVRQKKDGSGSYAVQTAWAHTSDRDGALKRFPEEIEVFCQRDDLNKPQPYKIGMYQPAPNSLRVSYKRLEFGFMSLVPVVQKVTQKVA